jgi:hypothetical protein
MTVRLEDISVDDILVIADVLDQVRQDHHINGPSIIDARSEGECARVLDGSLEGDLRLNYTRLCAETEGTA